MHITLLTHQRELNKTTNTGTLVTQVLKGDANLVVWERKNPNADLLQHIERGNVALLYPSENSDLISEHTNFDSFIVLDATWQEAQKMFNQSPYLQALPKVKVASSEKSIYTLRRNQKPDGLCTAECVIELLKVKGLTEKADELQQRLVEFVDN